MNGTALLLIQSISKATSFERVDDVTVCTSWVFFVTDFDQNRLCLYSYSTTIINWIHLNSFKCPLYVSKLHYFQGMDNWSSIRVFGASSERCNGLWSCEVWGSYRRVAEDSSLLECDAAPLGEQIPASRRIEVFLF
jgi:hypothetical protein